MVVDTFHKLCPMKIAKISKIDGLPLHMSFHFGICIIDHQIQVMFNFHYGGRFRSGVMSLKNRNINKICCLRTWNQFFIKYIYSCINKMTGIWKRSVALLMFPLKIIIYLFLLCMCLHDKFYIFVFSGSISWPCQLFACFYFLEKGRSLIKFSPCSIDLSSFIGQFFSFFFFFLLFPYQKLNKYF